MLGMADNKPDQSKPTGKSENSVKSDKPRRIQIPKLDLSRVTTQEAQQQLDTNLERIDSLAERRDNLVDRTKGIEHLGDGINLIVQGLTYFLNANLSDMELDIQGIEHEMAVLAGVNQQLRPFAAGIAAPQLSVVPKPPKQ